MDLVLTLVQRKQNSMLIRPAMAIALQCYRDLQTPYGFTMRNQKLLDIKRLMELIKVFGDTPEGEEITLDLKDMLVVVTAFDIAIKSLSSAEPYRFLPVLEDDRKKRAALRNEIVQICKEMTEELSEQAINRHEVQQHRRYLSQFAY